MPGSEEKLRNLQECVDLPVIAVSAKYHHGIDPLLMHLREMYDKYVDKK